LLANKPYATVTKFYVRKGHFDSNVVQELQRDFS